MKAVGVEAVSVDEFTEYVCSSGKEIIDELFTQVEKDHCWQTRRSLAAFAGLFAAKEALVKACAELGAACGGVKWVDLEVTHGSDGRPRFRIEGRSLENIKRSGAAEVKLSISRNDNQAVACVVVA